MKLRTILPLFALAALLSACATSSSSTGPAPVPTPADKPIIVIYPGQTPSPYHILGQVSGPSMSALKDQARKIGADAIMSPREKDPVSGWATTDAIKFVK